MYIADAYHNSVALQATLRGLCDDLDIPFQREMLKYVELLFRLFRKLALLLLPSSSTDEEYYR